MASEAETVKPDEPAATAQVRESPDVISADGSQPNEQEVKHGAAEMAKPIEATAQTNDAAEALNTLSLEPSNEPIRATKLFIGGLSYDTTDDSLGEYFAQADLNSFFWRFAADMEGSEDVHVVGPDVANESVALEFDTFTGSSWMRLSRQAGKSWREFRTCREYTYSPRICLLPEISAISTIRN